MIEGPGYELSSGTVIHPSISLESGYISNVFYEEDDPVASAVVRVIGGIAIASQNYRPPEQREPGMITETMEAEEAPPSSQLDFSLKALIIGQGYASGNDRVRDQSDIAGSADGHVIVFPQGDFAFQLDDTFIRDARPKNFETFGNLNRIYNHLALGGMYQPGEHAIRVGLRYENVIDRFDSGQSSFANRLQHLVAARGEWLYLPYTKFYADVSLGFFSGLSSSATGFKSDSMPLRAQVGIATALSVLTTLRAYAGYANGFYDAGPSFNMAIGGVEFGYRYTDYGRFTIAAGYDFHDSLQANYYQDILLEGRLDQEFGLLVVGANAGVRLRGYRGIPAAIGAENRDDVIFNAGANARYLFRERIGITARLEAIIDQTDYMYDAGGVTRSPEFTRFEAYLGAAAAF